MSLPIISADQRLAEKRGVKGVLVGKSGIGKTSQLWTLNPTATLFFDLEAGDLAVEGWAGDTLRPRTWQECRDFAVYIGGPNPALREEQPYSQAHFDAVCARFGDPRSSTATTPCSSTRSPSPGGSACNGAKASRRLSPRRPASPTAAVPTA
jgi:hypothetical protein